MKIVAFLLCIFAALYLVWPTPGFPPPPPDSFISNEPADTESIYRTAFYSNLSRAEVINYYKSQWHWPFIRLNHPPEFSFEFIRDQTRSSWLEELIHPWKDSLYINGFYPTTPQEQFNFNGHHYISKITLHYFPSSPITRLTILALTTISIYWLAREYAS
ncbi:hypothetical protein A3D85_02465 [Candidatus Amesbacteria bacterium RIFCSPHIGHO2_02_FULL_47_9]|uniref:Uncharacterized protein n=1 Tax=Candidatus Amesbacteria bacterium RIFCSPHIGHO2_01_FULL_48_32b TaxID=1797253 RepID=A0A1F4YDI5_9BACT|nr:MAG: hypothetical protein A2876_03360 [Candidatus Amesbacteria bacterium RIFCSPHIGHO2_01_FULL_48_32b]OGD02330.1 MAG: hypothetical protein A3D85_02465 [Candidatus Amesbacteria bacterium RIFCSPHIGHO2_02_FULL_47_9]OGD08489.1 MAG: hypothetical protein A2899_01700 [Candidatus Amesbacteria bacterium RIFCSPLOWO2_01_FULL_49_25]